jgi:hypothetical protein
LLLRELRQVAVARGADDLEALFLDRVGKRADARPEVFSERKSSSMMTMGNRKRSMANSRTAQ